MVELIISIAFGLFIFFWIINLPKIFHKPEKKVEPNKQLEYIGSIISVLEHQIDISETAREPVDLTDWEEHIGILISREDAEAIVGFYYSMLQENENKV